MGNDPALTIEEEEEEEEEVQVLHPLSYMSGNLKKKMEEVLGCRFYNKDRSDFSSVMLLF